MCGPSAPDDGPVAPMPRDGTQRAPFLALWLPSIVVKMPEPSRYAVPPARAPSPGASHNEIQALLCVWQT